MHPVHVQVVPPQFRSHNLQRFYAVVLYDLVLPSAAISELDATAGKLITIGQTTNGLLQANFGRQASFQLLSTASHMPIANMEAIMHLGDLFPVKDWSDMLVCK